jgi:hypothetical protein
MIERRLRPLIWTRGGFPDSVLAADDAESAIWRHAFIRSKLSET